jgi:hypothetical protein
MVTFKKRYTYTYASREIWIYLYIIDINMYVLFYTYMRYIVITNQHVLFSLGNKDHEQYFKDNFMVSNITQNRRPRNDQDGNGDNGPFFYSIVRELTGAELMRKIKERSIFFTINYIYIQIYIYVSRYMNMSIFIFVNIRIFKYIYESVIAGYKKLIGFIIKA